MKTRRWLAIMACVGLLGCGSEEAAEEAPAEEAPAEAPAEEAPAEEPAEEAEAAADEEPAAEEVGEAAAEGEGTPCEQAFASVQELRRQLEEQMGGNNQAAPLDRDQYLERCNQLPEGAQRCMIMSYAAEHGEECAQFQGQINGE